MMAPLGHRLRRCGWKTLHWGYPSWRLPIPELADRFRRTLEQLENDPDIRTLHIVGHSMGCIVARAALTGARPRKLGRIVMICPPNRGSHWARWLAPVFGRISPPLRDLSDHPNSFVNRLPDNLPQYCDVGIIRARWDWIVRPANASMPGIRDSIDVPAIHSSVLWRAVTGRYVDAYLRLGRFRRESPPP